MGEQKLAYYQTHDREILVQIFFNMTDQWKNLM